MYNCFKSARLLSLQAASHFIVCVMTLEPSSIYNCFKSTILLSLQAASYSIVCVMTLSHPLYITVLNQQYCSVYKLLATSLFVL